MHSDVFIMMWSDILEWRGCRGGLWRFKNSSTVARQLGGAARNGWTTFWQSCQHLLGTPWKSRAFSVSAKDKLTFGQPFGLWYSRIFLDNPAGSCSSWICNVCPGCLTEADGVRQDNLKKQRLSSASGSRDRQSSGVWKKKDRAALLKRITNGAHSAQPGAVCTAVVGCWSCFLFEITLGDQDEFTKLGNGAREVQEGWRSVLGSHRWESTGLGPEPCPLDSGLGRAPLPYLLTSGIPAISRPLSPSCPSPACSWSRFLLTRSQALPYTCALKPPSIWNFCNIFHYVYIIALYSKRRNKGLPVFPCPQFIRV